MKSRLLGAVCTCLTGLGLSFTVSAASFTPLGDLPGGDFFSRTHGVSADGGTVVGTSDSSSAQEAFRWTEATGMTVLGNLGRTFNNIAGDSSADGSVVVGYAYTTSTVEGFRWTEATGMTGLGGLGSSTPGSSYDFVSNAWGVSDDGSVIVGGGFSTSGFEAYRWTEATGMVGLGDLPGGNFSSESSDISADGSVVVGGASSVSSGSFREAFRWTEGTGMVGLGDLPGGIFRSAASASSADGSVIVGQGYTDFGKRAFRWTEMAGMVALEDLADDLVVSSAKAVSSNGSVVVGQFAQTGASSSEAFIWDEANGMRKIADLLTAEGIDLTGWTLVDAQGVSANGSTIVGHGINPDGNLEAWRGSYSIVPIPPALYLFGSGLIGLVVMARRKAA